MPLTWPCAPIQRMSNKEKKTPSKPWITKGMLTQINANNRIYRKYRRTKNQNTKEELYNSLKFHRHTLHKLTRLSKANRYRSYFEET